jgi:hypothetical protein
MRLRVGECGGPKPNFKVHTALGMAGGRALLSTIDKQDDARCYGEDPTLAPCADVPVAGARAMSALRQQHIAPRVVVDTHSMPCHCCAGTSSLPLLVRNDVSRVSTGNTQRTREPSSIARPMPLATVICHPSHTDAENVGSRLRARNAGPLPTLQLPPESCEHLHRDSPDTHRQKPGPRCHVFPVQSTLQRLLIFPTLHPSATCPPE